MNKIKNKNKKNNNCKDGPIAFGIDALLEYEYYLPFFYNMLDIFPRAPIYTYAHRRNQALGVMSTRKIFSSPLTHVAGSRRSLQHLSPLIPGLAKSFQLDPSVQIYLSFSTGLAQGIAMASGKKTQQLCYLYSNQASSGIFAGLLNQYRQASFQNIQKILLPSVFQQKLFQTFCPLNIANEVIYPGIDWKDFVQKDQVAVENYYAVWSEISEATAKMLINIAHDRQRRLIFFGNDQHLLRLKKKIQRDTTALGRNVSFFGNRCSGEIAQILAKARATIDLSEAPFPYYGLGSLLAQRPVIVGNKYIFQEFFQKNCGIYCNAAAGGTSELEHAFLTMDTQYDWYVGQDLMRHAQKYSVPAFQQQLKEQVLKYIE